LQGEIGAQNLTYPVPPGSLCFTHSLNRQDKDSAPKKEKAPMGDCLYLWKLEGRSLVRLTGERSGPDSRTKLA
jgi:hypothetical protein